MITLREKDIDSFFDVPFNIYPTGHFVSLFKDDIKKFLSDKNPLFRKGDNYSFYTAFENGKAVGRIVVLIHHDSNKKHNLHWAYFGIKKFIKDACLVLNEGFAKNPYFTAITAEEFEFQAKDLMLVLDPGLTVIAYHEGRPVGIVICIPDLNPLLFSVKSKLGLSFLFKFIWFKIFNKRAAIIFYSVTPSFHGQGINQAILKRVVTNLKKKGHEKLGITWIADENKSSLRQMEIIAAKSTHHLCLFKKKI